MGEGPVMARVRHRRGRYYAAITAVVVLGVGVAVGTTVAGANAAPSTPLAVPVPATSSASTWSFVPKTATPIKHVVVIFDENSRSTTTSGPTRTRPTPTGARSTPSAAPRR